MSAPILAAFLGTLVNPTAASGTGTSNAPAANVSVNAGLATATGTAYAATIDLTPRTFADAGVASATGTSNSGTTTISPSIGSLSAAGTAYDAVTMPINAQVINGVTTIGAPVLAGETLPTPSTIAAPATVPTPTVGTLVPVSTISATAALRLTADSRYVRMTLTNYSTTNPAAAREVRFIGGWNLRSNVVGNTSQSPTHSFTATTDRYVRLTFTRFAPPTSTYSQLAVTEVTAGTMPAPVAYSPDPPFGGNVASNVVDGNGATWWQLDYVTLNPQLIIDRGSGAPSFSSVTIGFYPDDAFVGWDYLIETLPVLPTASTPDPTLGSAQPGSYAVDMNPTTWWQPETGSPYAHHLVIDRGAGAAGIPFTGLVVDWYDSTYLGYDWLWQISDDGSIWNTIASITGNTSARSVDYFTSYFDRIIRTNPNVQLRVAASLPPPSIHANVTGYVSTTPRWSLRDPDTGQLYEFDINPSQEDYQPFSKNILYKNTLPNKSIIYEVQKDATSISWSGTVLLEGQLGALQTWFDNRAVVTLTDDLGREFDIYITEFTPKRVRNVEFPWYHTYDMKALVV